MHPQPLRHHYIPQFILRNFCFENKRLHYYDKQTGCISVKETRDVFMARNLYRDEINYAADPVKIEKDLAEYEREVAQIIKDRFLNEREIFLSIEEEAKLRLFFAIMGFRSLNARHCFGEKISKQSEAFYKQYQSDGNIIDMWKRNLGHIVQCRSFEEVWNHPHIDDPMKLFFRRDTVGYFGKYIAVAEANSENAFVIGDTYPVVISGMLPNGLPLNMYDIFPISSKRVLFMANNGVEGTPRDVLVLREFLFQPPKYIEEASMLRIRVKKLCTDEVQYINREVAKTAHHGFAFCNLSMPLFELNT
jgi:hypothetical protein